MMKKDGHGIINESMQNNMRAQEELPAKLRGKRRRVSAGEGEGEVSTRGFW